MLAPPFDLNLVNVHLVSRYSPDPFDVPNIAIEFVQQSPDAQPTVITEDIDGRLTWVEWGFDGVHTVAHAHGVLYVSSPGGQFVTRIEPTEYARMLRQARLNQPTIPMSRTQITPPIPDTYGDW